MPTPRLPVVLCVLTGGLTPCAAAQTQDRYRAVSNIMKTRHGTVKNLISNVRWGDLLSSCYVPILIRAGKQHE